MKKNKKKIIIIIISSIVAALAIAVAIPFSIMGIRTSNMKSNYGYLKTNATYSQKVEVTGLELVTQHVSCGYASIEMVSSYYGRKVTEDQLDARNKSVSTSTSKGFLDEISKCIPSRNFVMENYLQYDVMLKKIHKSLENNNPVVIEWAAKYQGEWTLHFSVVSGLDLANDSVQIYNPYGYIENITSKEFVSRTSFESYSNMPLFLNFGFAYGAFHKNTIFYAK